MPAATRIGALSTLALTGLLSAMTARASLGQTLEPQGPTAYRVLVTGAVRYPGRVTLTESTMTVPDALAAVGSPTIDAGDRVIVIHASEPGETPQGRTIALKDLDQGTVGVDVTLHDGDIVNVPLVERFFISGAVKRPGPYRLRAGTTVSLGIAMAGGLTAEGSDRRVKIGRTVKGKAVEVTADPGTALLPNDEIKVPRRMF